MAYLFFLSYARTNWDSYLERFHNALCSEVPYAASVDTPTASFLDRRDIVTGAVWNEFLAEAASTSLALVSICSRDYLNSDYCGKELQVFLNRFAQQGGKVSAIFPVLWGQPSKSIHHSYSHLQYTDDDLPAAYEAEGLRYLARLSQHDDDFKKFVTKFARKLVTAAENYPLPSLPVKASFDQVTNPFTQLSAKADRRADRPNARFVYVAAGAGQFKPPRTSVERYGGGGKEWCPYVPADERPIGFVAQEVASKQSVFYNELPPDANLIARLQQAERDREIVVMLVDAWTVRLRSYRELMEKYDKINFENHAVLVAWNAPDDETEAHRAELEQILKKTFRFKGTGRTNIHYRGSIKSAKALKAALANTLARLKIRLIASHDPQATIDAPELAQSAADKGYTLDSTPGVHSPSA
jgi:FxsC-like protein